MTRDELNAKLCEQFPMEADGEPPVLLADGFEDACLGLVARFGMNPVACYDRTKCIAILVERDGMTFEEAEEYFQFNTEGAWVGEGTPAFLIPFESNEAEAVDDDES